MFWTVYTVLAMGTVLSVFLLPVALVIPLYQFVSSLFFAHFAFLIILKLLGKSVTRSANNALFPGLFALAMFFIAPVIAIRTTVAAVIVIGLLLVWSWLSKPTQAEVIQLERYREAS